MPVSTVAIDPKYFDWDLKYEVYLGGVKISFTGVRPKLRLATQFIGYYLRLKEKLRYMCLIFRNTRFYNYHNILSIDKVLFIFYQIKFE